MGPQLGPKRARTVDLQLAIRSRSANCWIHQHFLNSYRDTRSASFGLSASVGVDGVQSLYAYPQKQNTHNLYLFDEGFHDGPQPGNLVCWGDILLT